MKITINTASYVEYHRAAPPRRGSKFAFHFLIDGKHVEHRGSYPSAERRVTQLARDAGVAEVHLLPYWTVTGGRLEVLPS